MLVLVTGAAGALGSALVRHLTSRGHKVAGVDRPAGTARLDALAAEVGPALFPRAVDESSVAATSAAIAEVERAAGEPVAGAALVAGGWRGGAPLHATKDDAAFDAMVDANLATVYHALRALLPGMVARRAGSIVVIGSRNVERPWTGAGAAAYTASKAGAVALAQAAAAEVLEHGVRVNAILPSTMDTPANRHAMPGADPARWVPTSSAAALVAFLLSDDARDVSGAAIPIYGRA